jgi:hypothetical protein
MMGETMPEQVLLVMAEDGGNPVAGALNMIGSHALFGRNWGCLHGQEIKHLHFELCYYQACYLLQNALRVLLLLFQISPVMQMRAFSLCDSELVVPLVPEDCLAGASYG